MRVFGTLILAILGILLVPEISIADDDFSSDLIDGSKWKYQEYARYVDADKGVFKAVVRTDNQEEDYQSWFRLANPESVTGAKTEVVLRSLSITQNDDNAHADVRLYGVFYNTQTIPSGCKGDVWARITIADRGEGLEAYWYVAEVADDEDSHSNNLGSGILEAAGTLTLNTTYVLEMVYDEAGGQLRFAIQDSTGNQIASDVFTINNRQSPAYEPNWVLGVTAVSDSAYINAEFDNVYTKAAASDDFSLYDTFDRFDAAKWQTNQVYRLIQNGKLSSMIQSLGESNYIHSVFQDNPDYIQTEVTVSSENEISPGDYGSARINGFFYNDSVPVDQQTGYRGNIYAAIAIEDRAGDLRAHCFMIKVLDDNFNQDETFWGKDFNDFTIQYDTAYTLSLKYTDATLIFTLSDGVNTQSHTYTIPDTTSVYPPNKEYRGLNTRICGCGSNAGGIMKAAFDNVATTPADSDNDNNSNSSSGGGGCFVQTSCP